MTDWNQRIKLLRSRIAANREELKLIGLEITDLSADAMGAGLDEASCAKLLGALTQMQADLSGFTPTKGN